MSDGIGKPVFHTAPRARGRDLDPVCELPYRPAADERPQQRPNRCQHLTTRNTVPKILLALTEASTDVKRPDVVVSRWRIGRCGVAGFIEGECRRERGDARVRLREDRQR